VLEAVLLVAMPAHAHLELVITARQPPAHAQPRLDALREVLPLVGAYRERVRRAVRALQHGERRRVLLRVVEHVADRAAQHPVELVPVAEELVAVGRRRHVEAARQNGEVARLVLLVSRVEAVALGRRVATQGWSPKSSSVRPR